MSELKKRIAYSKKLRSKATIEKRAIIRKTNCHTYIVLTNDKENKVIKEFSTALFSEKGHRKSVNGKASAEKLASLVVNYLKDSGSEEVFLFDRRHYKYHGVVKVIAETLRSSGIIS